MAWSKVRKLISSRRVMLNGNICFDDARRLKLLDVVKLLPHPSLAPPTETDIRIVFLDRHVVVVEKPSGITSTRHKEEKIGLTGENNSSPRSMKCCLP